MYFISLSTLLNDSQPTGCRKHEENVRTPLAGDMINADDSTDEAVGLGQHLTRTAATPLHDC